MAPRGYISPTIPNPNGPNDARIIIYGYTPSFTLCILAILLFFLSSLLHTFQLLKYKTYYFIPLSFACVLEAVGYVLRSLSAKRDPYHVIYFVVQYFCIVTAPVFISASVYVCLSRLITWGRGEGFSDGGGGGGGGGGDGGVGGVGGGRGGTSRLLRPKGILWGFVTADVVCTIVQVAGAALIGSAESNRKSSETPNNILLAGLAVQTFTFTIFLFLLATFRYSLTRLAASHQSVVRAKDPFFAALGAASLLIYLRTIFRLAETSQGVFGYLSSHEAFFGALEFAPVVAAVWILAVWHPGRWIPGKVVSGREREAAGTVNGNLEKS